jgi:hypothetical protein
MYTCTSSIAIHQWTLAHPQSVQLFPQHVQSLRMMIASMLNDLPLPDGGPRRSPTNDLVDKYTTRSVLHCGPRVPPQWGAVYPATVRVRSLGTQQGIILTVLL